MIQQTTFLLRFIFHPQQDQAIKETVPVPLVPLEQKLLARGGARMVYRLEPDLEPLLRRGEVFDELAELVPGELHTCHANAARFWNENREALALAACRREETRSGARLTPPCMCWHTGLKNLMALSYDHGTRIATHRGASQLEKKTCFSRRRSDPRK